MALVEALYPLLDICRFKKSLDNDFVDRLNHRHTVVLFLVLSVAVSAKQYIGEPINCWCPAEFTPEWSEYANKVCWSTNTYYVPINQDIPDSEDNKVERIAYYQWVPFIVVMQAVFFLLPSYLWSWLNRKSGMQFKDVVSKAINGERLGHNLRRKTVRHIAETIDRVLRAQKEYRKGCYGWCRQSMMSTCCCLCCGRRYGNYLVSLYLLIKLLYLANGVGQLFLLNAFLGDPYHLYGYEALYDMIRGNTWTTSVKFPRITLCDFSIRTLGNRIHEYVVQCVLTNNLYNEKVFLFIWLWLVFISLVTTLSFISWVWTLFLYNRHDYIKKHLKIMQRNFDGKNSESYRPTRKFSDIYLRQDGTFMLKMISANTNEVTAGEVIDRLWVIYCDREKRNEVKTKFFSAEDV